MPQPLELPATTEVHPVTVPLIAVGCATSPSWAIPAAPRLLSPHRYAAPPARSPAIVAIDSVTLDQSVAVPIWVGDVPYCSGLLGDGLLPQQNSAPFARSEERRVGKECRSRWSPY